MTSREVARAARRMADQSSDQLASIPALRGFFASVAVASPLTVIWRGVNVPAAAKDKTYTPVVGDWVLCVLLNDQPVVICATGAP